MMSRGAVFCIAAVLLVVSAAGTARAAAPVDPAHLAITDCPQAPGCPALMLLEEIELDNDGPRSVYSLRRVTKLFTQEGIDSYSDVQLESQVGKWDIRDLTGRTILPNGTAIELGQSQVGSKTLKRGKRYIVVKSAKFPAVVPGAIIEYSYKILTPPYVRMADAYWYPQKEIPVLRSQFRMKPGDMEMTWKKTGSEKVDIKQTNPTRKSVQFTAENVPALPDEPYGPPDEALQATMYFCKSNMQTMELGKLSTRIAASAGDFIANSDAIQKKLGELTAPADTALDKVKKIYKFVQEQIGTEQMRPEGGADAADAAAVLARGWGTEWERTLLFLSMVSAAGLEQGLLLITGRFSAALDPNLPELADFDSFAATVKIGSTWTFYDPATRHCPFGMVSAEKEGGAFNALIVTPRSLPPGNREEQIEQMVNSGRAGGYRIAAVPFSVSHKNVLTREVLVSLPGDGSAVADVTEQGTGLADLDIRDRYELEDEMARREALLEQVQRLQADAELLSSSFDSIESFESPAMLKYQMKLPGFASMVGDRIVIVPSMLDARRVNPFTAETRRSAVSLPYCKRTMTKIRIPIPEGYAVEELPPIVAIREAPFTLTIAYGEESGSLTLARRLEIETARVNVEDYPKLRDFYRKVQEADKQPVVLKKKS